MSVPELPTSGSSPSSNAASSSSSTTRQADPLPRKVAEFGYAASEESFSQHENASTSDLPLDSHPAERETRSSNTDTASRPSHPTGNASTASLPTTISSINSHNKQRKVYRSCLNFFRGKPQATNEDALPLLWGIELPTLVRLITTFVILIGVVIGWALTIVVVNKEGSKSSKPSSDGNGNSGSFSAGQSDIFIHTGFGVITLILLLLLERAVFIARAERYVFKHPSSGSAASRIAALRSGGGSGGRGLALAPWNRPSLPTYANAVGFRGTGDVEDQAIAGPAPPEYGNTRGSTLLLSNPLLLARAMSQRSSRSRPTSTASSNLNSGLRPLRLSAQAQIPRMVSLNEDNSDPRGRPVSYHRSHYSFQAPPSPPYFILPPARPESGLGVQLQLPATAASNASHFHIARAASRLSDVPYRDDARLSLTLLAALERGDGGRRDSAGTLERSDSGKPLWMEEYLAKPETARARK